MKKLIIVNTIGQLPLFGGITGPILRPFYCDVDHIRTMIALRVSVQEIANRDGKPIIRNGKYVTIDLDLNNYDKTNYIPEQPRKNFNNNNNNNQNRNNNQNKKFNNNTNQKSQQQNNQKQPEVKTEESIEETKK